MSYVFWPSNTSTTVQIMPSTFTGLGESSRGQTMTMRPGVLGSL
jgi:hypothetical protein